MQLPMLAGVMTATAIDDGMRLMVAQERAIGKPSSGAECGKQVFFSCGTGARHPNARAIWRRVGRTTWSQPSHSLALLVCLPSSDRREAAGSGHLRTTGDGRHPERPARIVQCSSTSTSAPSDRASSGPCLCLQRSQKGRCQSQQDERIGPGEQATRKKGTYGLGARGWGLCTSKIRSRTRRLKNTQSEGPAREPLTVQAPRRLASASTFSPSVLVLGGEFLKRGGGGWGRIGMGWRGLVIVTAGGVPRYLGQSLAPSIGSSRLPAIVGQLFSSASALLSFFFGRWMEPSTGHTPRHHPFSASI